MSRSRTLVLSLLAFSGVLGLALSACETPLDGTYELTSPRILAIRTEPVDLVPDGQVNIDALIYAPPGSAAPVYTWSWCASVNATLQCATTAAALIALLDPDGTLGVEINYDLGSSATAQLTYPVSPDVIRAACARRIIEGGVDEAGDDEGGVDAGEGGVGPSGLACNGMSWTIDLLLTVTVGSKTMQATRQLTLYLDAPTQLNSNPTVLGLAPFTPSPQITEDSGPIDDPGASGEGGEVDAGIGTANGATVIAADVPASSSELVGDAGVYESLNLAWYVEKGALDHATTVLPAAPSGATRDYQALLVNRWVAASGNTTFILVIRDNRGGVGWTTAQASMP